jgi:hypothetical protein
VVANEHIAPFLDAVLVHLYKVQMDRIWCTSGFEESSDRKPQNQHFPSMDLGICCDSHEGTGG